MKDQITYNTHGTCSRQIVIDIEDDIIVGVSFIGGCSGNTQGVSRLVTGMTVDEVIDKLSGIRCGYKKTSCPDQLAQALAGYKSNNGELTANKQER